MKEVEIDYSNVNFKRASLWCAFYTEGKSIQVSSKYLSSRVIACADRRMEGRGVQTSIQKQENHNAFN